jgi:hypothetical protein
MTHDRMNPMQRIAIAVTKRLPPIFIADTERIGLSLGFVVIGAVSLSTLDNPSVFTNTYAKYIVVLWSITLIVGGVLTIWGMYFGKRLTERAGITLAGIGCATYGITLIIGGGGRSILVGALFVVLAIVKAIRLLVSTASAAYNRE